MYIHTKIEEIQKQKEDLESKVCDVDFEINNEKLQMHADIRAYEGKLVEDSDISKLESEIKEREKKISLITKMIREKTEKYREKLQAKKEKTFVKLETKKTELKEQIQNSHFTAKVNIGDLVEEIKFLTVNEYKPEITHLKGDICDICRQMSILEAMDTLFKSEYDLYFTVKIGPYSFNTKIKIDDKTADGRKVYECLQKVGVLQSYSIGSRIKFPMYEVKEIYVNIDEKTFNEIYAKEEKKDKYILSKAISNLVEHQDINNHIN